MEFVSWGYYSQLNGKSKTCSKPAASYNLCNEFYNHETGTPKMNQYSNWVMISNCQALPDTNTRVSGVNDLLKSLTYDLYIYIVLYNTHMVIIEM